MTATDAKNLMDQLKNGEINECHVSNEHFLIFQRELVKREDFKHFRGVAQRGGVCYILLYERAKKLMNRFSLNKNIKKMFKPKKTGNNK